MPIYTYKLTSPIVFLNSSLINVTLYHAMQINFLICWSIENLTKILHIFTFASDHFKVPYKISKAMLI